MLPWLALWPLHLLRCLCALLLSKCRESTWSKCSLPFLDLCSPKLALHSSSSNPVSLWLSGFGFSLSCSFSGFFGSFLSSFLFSLNKQTKPQPNQINKENKKAQKQVSKGTETELRRGEVPCSSQGLRRGKKTYCSYCICQRAVDSISTGTIDSHPSLTSHALLQPVRGFEAKAAYLLGKHAPQVTSLVPLYYFMKNPFNQHLELNLESTPCEGQSCIKPW